MAHRTGSSRNGGVPAPHMRLDLAGHDRPPPAGPPPHLTRRGRRPAPARGVVDVSAWWHRYVENASPGTAPAKPIRHGVDPPPPPGRRRTIRPGDVLPRRRPH